MPQISLIALEQARIQENYGRILPNPGYRCIGVRLILSVELLLRLLLLSGVAEGDAAWVLLLQTVAEVKGTLPGRELP